MGAAIPLVVTPLAVLLAAIGVVTNIVVDHEAAPTTRPTSALVRLHRGLSARSTEKLVTPPRYVSTAMMRTLVLSHALQLWLPPLVPTPVGTRTPT
jgi:hypothetical protein